MQMLGDDALLSARQGLSDDSAPWVLEAYWGGDLFKIMTSSMRWSGYSLASEGLGLLYTPDHPYQPTCPSLVLWRVTLLF